MKKCTDAPLKNVAIKKCLVLLVRVLMESEALQEFSHGFLIFCPVQCAEIACLSLTWVFSETLAWFLTNGCSG